MTPKPDQYSTSITPPASHPVKSASRWFANRYNRLLLMLLTMFLGRPIWQHLWIGTLIYSSFTLVVVLMLVSSSLFNRRGRWIFLTLAGLAFVTQIADYLFPDAISMSENTVYSVTGLLINVAFLGLAAYLMAKELFLQDRATGDMIKGGICAYFIIGICWSILYQILVLYNPGAFQVGCTNCSLDLFYFSFTTLTTVGYGETIPISDWARTLANLEAIVGLMYPSIYIARLVSLYRQEQG